MKIKTEEGLFYSLLIGAIFGLLISLILSNTEPVRRKKWEAWCALEQRSDLTFEQWDTLRQSGLLPRR